MKSFTIYKEYYELITLLPEKEQQELLLAITKYMFEDTIPELNERQTKIFNNLKRPLDSSKENSRRRIKTAKEENQEETEKNPNENQNKTELKPKDNQKETKKKPTENQNNNQKKTHQDVNVIVNVNNNLNNNINLIKYLESIFNRKLNSIEIEEISKWNDNELTRYAIKQSALNGTYNLKYIMAILDYYQKNNIHTVAEAVKDNARFKSKKLGALPDWFNNTKKSNEKISVEEQKEIEELLKEFK